jgi:hypothetical protein
MRQKFSLIHPKIEGDITYEFEDEYLYGFKINATGLETNLIRVILTRLPLTQDMLAKVSTDPLVKILEIKEVITFEVFWDAYDYKVGNKSRAMKLFNSLTEGEKQAALSYIPKYNHFVNDKRINKLYAETYLNQKRFAVK